MLGGIGMCSSKNRVSVSLAVAFVVTGNSLTAADPPWKNKPTAEWTQEEAFQVLTSSPWVKNFKPDVLHAQSEFERRDGGNMGKPSGLGFDGIGDSESIFWSRRVGEVPKLVLRWETALPVRAARSKAHTPPKPPALSAEAYSLAVYGIPGGDYKGTPAKLGKPLRNQAVLRRVGKKDIKPLSVKVFLQGDESPIIVYEFSRTIEITKDDKSLAFLAIIGRLSVAQVFYPEDMQFQGSIEF
jgi:hypothetical protein